MDTTQLHGSTVADLRNQIDEVDALLVGLISRRRALAMGLGEAKRTENIPLDDPAREAWVVRRAAEHTRTLGHDLTDVEDVRSIFWRLIQMSRRTQQRGG